MTYKNDLQKKLCSLIVLHNLPLWARWMVWVCRNICFSVTHSDPPSTKGSLLEPLGDLPQKEISERPRFCRWSLPAMATSQ